jgi:hypothetical protein
MNDILAMRYLITMPNEPPAVTPWFTLENFYVSGMTVYDLYQFKYCDDGIEWKDIREDHL